MRVEETQRSVKQHRLGAAGWGQGRGGAWGARVAAMETCEDGVTVFGGTGTLDCSTEKATLRGRLARWRNGRMRSGKQGCKRAQRICNANTPVTGL